MLDRCRSTVRTLRHNRSAIASLVSPPATSSRTSSSRALSSASEASGGGEGAAGRKESSSTRKLLPRGLVGQQDVVGGVEQDEPRTGDAGGEQPALLDGHDAIVARVQHERWRRDLARTVEHVDVVAGVIEPHGGLGRGRTPLQLVVPRHLLSAAVGKEQHAEQVPEGRGRLRPPGADRGDHRLAVRALLGAAPSSPARVGAIKDEVGDAIRMPRRIDERDGRALRNAEQREPLEPGSGDHVSRSADPYINDKSPTSRSDSPHPRSSYRTTVRPSHRAPRASAARQGSPSQNPDASATSPPARSAARLPCTA